jgi:hypothetical protein
MDPRYLEDQARLTLRAQARVLARSPQDPGAHLARLHAALQLPDTEPVQGVLADMFVALPRQEAQLRQAALQMADGRLSPYVAEAFQRHSQGYGLPPITALATRWSVIAHPSADVPARVRRANPDHSRQMAQAVVRALCEGEPGEAARTETEFLDHCTRCQDKLAFMLATRELRRREIALDDRWSRTASWLEQRDAMGRDQAAEHRTESK